MEIEVLRLFEFANYLLLAIFFTYFVDTLSEKKRFSNKALQYVVCIAVYQFGAAGNIFAKVYFDDIGSILSDVFRFVVFSLIVIVLVNKDSILKKLKLFLIIFIPNSFTRSFIWLVINMYADSFTTHIAKRSMDSLGSIMSMMCEIVFYVTVAILSDKKRFREFDYAIIILWFFPILGFIDVTFALQSPNEVSQINLIAGSLQLLMASVICKLIVRFIHMTENVISREKEASKLENLRDLNKQYYETVQSDIAYVQKFRHDIANYIEQVEVMRLKDDAESRKITDEMVESLKNKANEIRSKRYCEHQLANMILTLKAEKSKNLGIDYTVKANVPEDIRIESLDLSSILSNMIDNAIHSAVKYKEVNGQGSVSVSMGMMGDYLAIRTDNDTLIEEHIDNIKKLFKDASDRRDGHGYGLLIIDENIKKYDGSTVVDIKDKKSSIVVTIKVGDEGVIKNV